MSNNKFNKVFQPIVSVLHSLHHIATRHSYLLYKAEKLSVVCLSALFGMLISQLCQHGLKWDLLEVKAVSLRITKFIFTSL